MDKAKDDNKKKLADAITNMIDEGSEKVTTLSDEPEAKYESWGEKVPGKESEQD